MQVVEESVCVPAGVGSYRSFFLRWRGLQPRAYYAKQQLGERIFP